MSKRKKQSTKRCSSSGGGKQYFDLIPIDLIIKIFSRLMCSKSMGKCRCVSKQWSSILRGPDLNQLFPINSPEPPRFLITFQGGTKLVYFSSPQPHNPDENSSIVATLHQPHNPDENSSIVATPRISDFCVSQISRPVRGWLCHQVSTMIVVLNPISGQTIRLPKIIYDEMVDPRTYFGYDPVHNQFKVLCTTSVSLGASATKNPALQHHVLTLETGNLLWRKIEFCIPYYDLRNDDGICINGTIYYNASITEEPTIVCFNVRHERFNIIVGRARERATLINYKGKLGAVYINYDYTDLVLSVLEDAEEQEWSEQVYEIPLHLRHLRPFYACCLDATSKGEIVFHPKFGVVDCFYIYYYNLEKKNMVRVRVEVPGFEVFENHRMFSFANYVEVVKLM